jgi:hypothetical protein
MLAPGNVIRQFSERPFNIADLSRLRFTTRAAAANALITGQSPFLRSYTANGSSVSHHLIDSPQLFRIIRSQRTINFD